jgi:hypothetical protein
MIGMSRILLVAFLAAQTVIVPPDNKYSVADDVKMGLEAADQAERQLPVMKDDEVTSYIEGVGRRLVDAIPPSLQHSEFHYGFKAINVREINAFALPGGPMYVNRGMIEAAKTEGEVAGVMAHEISHVVLRHGTAQASKAGKYEVGAAAGAVAGAVLGAIFGGGVGNVVAGATRFGVGAAFLRYSRDYERQADIQGAQILARAGYEPREMANMFKTIKEQSGSNGPEWLSDHPDPGNRYEAIMKEAATLHVDRPLTDTRDFDQVQAHLKKLPRAPTTQEATKASAAGGRARDAEVSTSAPPSGAVEAPSPRSTQYTDGRLFRVSVPTNWRQIRGSGGVTFAPPGAYGAINGQNVFTHGVELGLARQGPADVQTAAEQFIDVMSQANPGLRRAAEYERIVIDGRRGVRTLLSNRSEATGQPETIAFYATQLRSGGLFYLLGVSPTDSSQEYQSTFNRIVESLRLAN